MKQARDVKAFCLKQSYVTFSHCQHLKAKVKKHHVEIKIWYWNISIAVFRESSNWGVSKVWIAGSTKAFIIIIIYIIIIVATGYLVCKFSRLLINSCKQFTISIDVYLIMEAVTSESL